MKKTFKLIAVLVLMVGLVACNDKGEEKVKGDEEITIYLVRHGKTFFNTTGQVQGFADSPLTDVGIEQAEMVGDGLKDIAFTTAYSSDLGRQRNTAKLILSKNANEVPELLEHDGFKEWNYGGFEGKTNAEMWDPIMNTYGLKFDEDWSDYEKLHELLGDDGIADAIAKHDELGEAETYDEIVTRGKAAMKELIKQTEKNGGGNVLVVSSGSMIPSLLTFLVPDQYKGESIGNCSVTILKYKDGKYTLDVIGDDSYLTK